MSMGLCIIVREDCEDGNGPMSSALVAFVRDEMDRRGWRQVDLEERSGIPDATLSRFLNGKVAEPKLSLVAQLAHAFGMEFWELVRKAGIRTGDPDDPSAESLRLAGAIEHQPWLRGLMDDASQLTLEDREVVQEYIALLSRRRKRRKGTRSSEAKE